MTREVRVLLSAAPWCVFSLQLEGDDVSAVAAAIIRQVESQPDRSEGVRAVTELVLKSNADAVGAARKRTSPLTNGLIRLLTWRF